LLRSRHMALDHMRARRVCSEILVGESVCLSATYAWHQPRKVVSDRWLARVTDTTLDSPQKNSFDAAAANQSRHSVSNTRQRHRCRARCYSALNQLA
jgi:hypothetical protein